MHCESKVSCPRTLDNNPNQAQTLTARSGLQLMNRYATAPQIETVTELKTHVACGKRSKL